MYQRLVMEKVVIQSDYFLYLGSTCLYFLNRLYLIFFHNLFDEI